MRRLRKWFLKEYGETIRYYVICEYGSQSFRPHYHLLLFHDSPRARADFRIVRTLPLSTKENPREICVKLDLADLWVYGDTTTKVTDGNMQEYVSKYLTQHSNFPRVLDKVRQEVKSEKLEAAKTEAKAAFVAKVGSLFGSNKLKEEREELQQRISALENQNKELIQHIKTMEQEHKEECTKFNEYVDKIQRYFPYVEKLLPLIYFCRTTLKFSERVIQKLCKLKEIRLKGDFYSPEFNRKFHDENAVFLFKEDKNRKGYYHICVNNNIPPVQWFRQKANE